MRLRSDPRTNGRQNPMLLVNIRWANRRLAEKSGTFEQVGKDTDVDGCVDLDSEIWRFKKNSDGEIFKRNWLTDKGVANDLGDLWYMGDRNILGRNRPICMWKYDEVPKRMETGEKSSKYEID